MRRQTAARLDAAISVLMLAVTAGAAVVIGAVSGWHPARAAARLLSADVTRREEGRGQRASRSRRLAPIGPRRLLRGSLEAGHRPGAPSEPAPGPYSR